MPASKLTKTQVANRRASALHLRMAGATLDDIATTLEYSGRTEGSRRAAVSKDLTRAFEAAQKNQARSVEQYRAMELERLDRLQRGLWPTAILGNVLAVRAVLKVMDRRARLLGLDAPVQVDTTVTETTQADLEFAEIVREAQAKASAEIAALTGEDGVA